MNIRLLILTAFCLYTQSAFSATNSAQRFVLAVGANNGGAHRETLQYAVSDAQNFVKVMQTMGGVNEGDHVLLADPLANDLEDALHTLRNRIASVESARREVLVYYSGHADENGLRLGESLFTYERLRNAMNIMGAEVQIAILDACASGAITRLKGGQRQKAFMVDASSNMQGYAFLTSSSEDEAAQESDAIGASFFTHYLVSGLRGAADATGDGQVTLNEAYQFAFQNTLERTERTQGGAQHPAYDIKMTGTGDVVITDVRQTSAGLILDKSLQGRFFIRNTNRQLIAELFKPAGRQVELGLEPGAYHIHLSQETQSATTSIKLGTDQRETLDESSFNIISRDPTIIRGNTYRGLAKRSRLELRFGSWDVDKRPVTGTSNVRVTATDLMASLGYAYWIEEHKAIFLSASTLASVADVRANQSGGATTDVSAVFTFLVGMRYYWLFSPQPTMRPYLTFGVGPYFGSEVQSRAGLSNNTVQTQAVFGGQLGSGIDLSLGRHFMAGILMGYHMTTNLDAAPSGRKNYNGLELSLSLSWVFGKGIK